MRFRGIPLPFHALVELIAGLALVVASLVFADGLAGSLLTFAGGIALAGLGLGAVEALPLAAHRSIDRALVTGLSGAAVVAALTGASVPAVLLLGAAALELALTSATRWTRAPIRL